MSGVTPEPGVVPAAKQGASDGGDFVKMRIVVAALAVLATEFVWAQRVLVKGQHVTKQAVARLRRVPLWVSIPAVVLIVAGIAVTVWWWLQR